MNDIKWLLEQRIIHRGMINSQCIDHARDSFLACMNYHYPIEVDLLFLADGEIVVWRDGSLKNFGIGQDSRMLSSITLKDVEVLCSMQENSGSQLKQMMTFKDFLDMIGGKLDLLIEIKELYKSPEIHEHVVSVLNNLGDYKGKYALHSANPMVLKEIRELNKDIPLGQISWSFNTVDVITEYKDLHQKFQFFDIIVPDFLGYDVRELEDNSVRIQVKKLCEMYGLPLIGWTVRNEKEERTAIDCCDNMIIEGNISYF